MSSSSRPGQPVGTSISASRTNVHGKLIELNTVNLERIDQELLKALLASNDPKRKRRDFLKKQQFEVTLQDPVSKKTTEYYFYLSHDIYVRDLGDQYYYEILGKSEPLSNYFEVIDIPDVATVDRVIARIDYDPATDKMNVQKCNHLAVTIHPVNPYRLVEESERGRLLYFVTNYCIKTNGQVYYTANHTNKIELANTILGDNAVAYLSLTHPLLCSPTNMHPFDPKDADRSPFGYELLILKEEIKKDVSRAGAHRYFSAAQLMPRDWDGFTLIEEKKCIRVFSVSNHAEVNQAERESRIGNQLNPAALVSVRNTHSIYLIANHVAGVRLSRIFREEGNIEVNDTIDIVNDRVDVILQTVEKSAIAVSRLAEKRVKDFDISLDNLMQLPSGEVVLMNIGEATLEEGRDVDVVPDDYAFGLMLNKVFSNLREKTQALSHLSALHRGQVVMLVNSLLGNKNKRAWKVDKVLETIRQIRFERRLANQNEYSQATLMGAFHAANEVNFELFALQFKDSAVGITDEKIAQFKKLILESLDRVGAEHAEEELFVSLFCDNTSTLNSETIAFTRNMYKDVRQVIVYFNHINKHMAAIIDAIAAVFTDPALVGHQAQMQAMMNTLNVIARDALHKFFKIDKRDAEKVEELLTSIQLHVDNKDSLALLGNFSKLFIAGDFDTLSAPMTGFLAAIQDLPLMYQSYTKLDKAKVDASKLAILEGFYSWLLQITDISERVLVSTKNNFLEHKAVFDKVVQQQAQKSETGLIGEFTTVLEVREFYSLTAKKEFSPFIANVFAKYQTLKAELVAKLEQLRSKKALFSTMESMLLDRGYSVRLQRRMNALEINILTEIDNFNELEFNFDAVCQRIDQAISNNISIISDLKDIVEQVDYMVIAANTATVIDPTQMTEDQRSIIDTVLHDYTPKESCVLRQEKVFLTLDMDSMGGSQSFAAFSLSKPIIRKVVNENTRDMVVGAQLDANMLLRSTTDSESDYSSVVRVFAIVGELTVQNNQEVEFVSDDYKIIDVVSAINPASMSLFQNKLLAQILSQQPDNEEAKSYSVGQECRAIRVNNASLIVYFNLTHGLQWRLHDREHATEHCYEIVGQYVGKGTFVESSYKSAGTLSPQEDGSLKWSSSPRIIKYYTYDPNNPKQQQAFQQQYQLALLIPYLDTKKLVFLAKKKLCAWIERFLGEETVSDTLQRDLAQEKVDLYKSLTLIRAMLLNNVFFADIGFVHNDLKPENIVFNPEKKRAFAFDTNLSVKANVTHSAQFAGSPLYAAPEKFDSLTCTFPSVDDFSFGVMAKRCVRAIPLQQNDVFDNYDYLEISVDAYLLYVKAGKLEEAKRIEKAVNAVVAASPYFSKNRNHQFPQRLQAFFREYYQVSTSIPEQLIDNELKNILAIGESSFSGIAQKEMFKQVVQVVAKTSSQTIDKVVQALRRIKQHCTRDFHAFIDNVESCLSVDPYKHKEDCLNKICKTINAEFVSSSRRHGVGVRAVAMAAAECVSTHYAVPLDFTDEESSLFLNLLNGLTDRRTLNVDNRNDELSSSSSSSSGRVKAKDSLATVDQLLFSLRLRQLDATDTALIKDVRKGHGMAYLVFNALFKLRTVKIGDLKPETFIPGHVDSLFWHLQDLHKPSDRPEVIAEVVETLDIEFLRSYQFTHMAKLVHCLEQVIYKYLSQKDELMKFLEMLNAMRAQCVTNLAANNCLEKLIKKVESTIHRSSDEKADFSFDNLLYLNSKQEKHLDMIRAEYARFTLILGTTTPVGSPILVSQGSSTFNSPRQNADQPTLRKSPAKRAGQSPTKRMRTGDDEAERMEVENHRQSISPRVIKVLNGP